MKNTGSKRIWVVAFIVPVVLILIGAGVFFYLSQDEALPKFEITTGVLKEENREHFYDIDVEYPEIKGDSEAVVKINKQVKNFVDKRVADFKSSTLEIEQQPFPDAKSSLVIRFEYGTRVKRGVHPTIYFRFEESPYIAGAAHPNGAVISSNFNLKTGDYLKLSDFFAYQSDFLSTISKLASDDLLKQFDTFKNSQDGLVDWIKAGTAPTADNYNDGSFYVKPEGFTLIFNPYQVAPYVFGEREVTIPWEQLRSYLAGEWAASVVFSKDDNQL
ncbi:MAG: DUF3298 domain-containing protein [Candidatus Vogelbacteria bacterium]|nr:DUF3298 domain-containing protein [Candidatus Vogelbacteria bacterium]